MTKCEKVINSCETKEQFEAAIKYFKLYTRRGLEAMALYSLSGIYSTLQPAHHMNRVGVTTGARLVAQMRLNVPRGAFGPCVERSARALESLKR